MVEIKFCGMTRGEDVAQASALGASYVGVIFAGGPRHLTGDSASRVLGACDIPPLRVAVVSEQTPDEIAEIARLASLDVIQLHANPNVDRIEAVRAATSC